MNFESIILSSPDKGIALEKDIRLIKLALLYSDKVTLVSPKTSMVVAMMQLSSLNQNEQFEFVKEIGPILDQDFKPEDLDVMVHQIRHLKSKRRKTREELIHIGRFESRFREISKSLKEVAEKVFDDSRFEELLPLIESGKLELRHLDIGGELDALGELMLNEVIDALGKSSTKYPVLDEVTGGLAHQYSIENDFEYSVQNPNEIEFGKELILSLPNIDSIGIQDLLNLKEELTNELAKFKGAIMDYSREIESDPYSTGARAEILKQYRYHIQPDLVNLREQIKRNKLIKQFTAEVMSNASSYLTQFGIFLCVCHILDFEKLLSAGGILTESTYKTWKNRKESTRQIREHPLFFYNELSSLKN